MLGLILFFTSTRLLHNIGRWHDHTPHKPGTGGGGRPGPGGGGGGGRPGGGGQQGGGSGGKITKTERDAINKMPPGPGKQAAIAKARASQGTTPKEALQAAAKKGRTGAGADAAAAAVGKLVDELSKIPGFNMDQFLLNYPGADLSQLDLSLPGVVQMLKNPPEWATNSFVTPDGRLVFTRGPDTNPNPGNTDAWVYNGSADVWEQVDPNSGFLLGGYANDQAWEKIKAAGGEFVSPTILMDQMPHGETDPSYSGTVWKTRFGYTPQSYMWGGGGGEAGGAAGGGAGAGEGGAGGGAGGGAPGAPGGTPAPGTPGAGGLDEEQEDIRDAFRAFLRDWELPETLLGWVTDALVRGKTQTEIQSELFKREEYLAVYPEGELRRARGLSWWNPSQIREYRDQAKQIARSFIGADLANGEITQLIERDISLPEWERNLDTWKNFQRWGPTVRMVLEQELGYAIPDDRAFAFLSPNIPTPELDRAYEKALMRGQPALLGLGVRPEEEAEMLRKFGISPEDAFRGYQDVARELPAQERFNLIEAEINKNIDRFPSPGQLFADTPFALLFRAIQLQETDAIQEIQRRVAREVARHQAGGGIASDGGALTGLASRAERGRTAV